MLSPLPQIEAEPGPGQAVETLGAAGGRGGRPHAPLRAVGGLCTHAGPFTRETLEGRVERIMGQPRVTIDPAHSAPSLAPRHLRGRDLFRAQTPLVEPDFSHHSLTPFLLVVSLALAVCMSHSVLWLPSAPSPLPLVTLRKLLAILAILALP